MEWESSPSRPITGGPAAFRGSNLCESEFGTHLVGGGELRPRFIGPAVVVLGVRGLHVLVEAQDLPGLQFGHRGSLGELRAEEEADY